MNHLLGMHKYLPEKEGRSSGKKIVYHSCMHRLFFAVLLAVSLAPLAHAEEIDAWDFRTGQHLPDGSQGLSAAKVTTNGLQIQTQTDGFLIWSAPFVHPVDVLTLRIRSAKQATLGLLWHPAEDLNLEMQRDISIPGQPVVQDINLSLYDWKSWNWKTPKIGLGFPAGSDVVIESMIWRRYSFTEKMATAWASFWTFDEFRVYSINFLWGPLVAFNPVALNELYDHLPPTAWSVTRLFYAVIALSAVMGFAFYLFDRKAGKRTMLLILCATITACWLVFDLRMGLELINYGIVDYRTFVQPEEKEKMFRTHGNFYSFGSAMLPTIRQYDRYVLYAPEPSPFYSNLRYMSYPSVILKPEQDTAGVKLWVVIGRPDIRAESGRLIDGTGQILSGTGRVVELYDTGTFLFATP